jgi:hypothetical protein
MPDNEQTIAAAPAMRPMQVGMPEIDAADVIEECIRAGDHAALWRFLDAAADSSGPLRPNPWALIGCLAGRAINIAPENARTGALEHTRRPCA